MNSRVLPRPVMACLVLLASCGGDGGTDPNLNLLVGSWRATTFEVANAASPSQKNDLVALGGGMTVELNANQTYRMTITVPGDPAEVTTGTWSSSGNVLTVQYTSQVTLQLTWARSGDTLTLDGASSEIDFDGDGTADDAILYLVLVPQ